MLHNAVARVFRRWRAFGTSFISTRTEGICKLDYGNHSDAGRRRSAFSCNLPCARRVKATVSKVTRIKDATRAWRLEFKCALAKRRTKPKSGSIDRRINFHYARIHSARRNVFVARRRLNFSPRKRTPCISKGNIRETARARNLD